MRLVDAHCHVNAERFGDDAEEVLEAARRAGVERILVPGWNVASCERARELAEAVAWIDIAVGVHPHDAAKVDDAGWRLIVGWAAGRAGPSRSARRGSTTTASSARSPDQLDNLRRNLRLAADTASRSILHCRSRAGERDAQDALLAELTAMRPRRPAIVVHSFSGPLDYALAMLDLGAVISFSGLVFRGGEEASAEVARLTPPDRLLVETDSPFLAPPGAPERPQRASATCGITADWVGEPARARAPSVSATPSSRPTTGRSAMRTQRVDRGVERSLDFT